MARFALSVILYCCLMGVTIADDAWSDVFHFQTKMAESGNVSAQFILGEMYEQGRGVKQDYNKALEWYDKAQKNGHADAADRIAKVKDLIANPPAKEVKKKPPVAARPKPEAAPAPRVVKVAKPAPAAKPKVTARKRAKPKTEDKPEAEIAKKPAIPVPPPLPHHGPPPDNKNRIKGTHFEEVGDAFE